MIVGLCLLHVPINSNWRNGMVWLTFSFSFHFLYILWYSICPYIMNSCDRCVELNIRMGYVIPHSRFWAPVPDCYRHASDRIVPFPISRITDFVFPTELSRSRFRFRIKIWKRKWSGYFPDRSWPLSSLPLWMKTYKWGVWINFYKKNHAHAKKISDCNSERSSGTLKS